MMVIAISNNAGEMIHQVDMDMGLMYYLLQKTLMSMRCSRVCMYVCVGVC